MRGIWSNNFWHYCFIQSLSESDYDEIPTWGHDSSERKSEHRRRHLRLKIGPYIWNSFDAPAKVQEFSLNSIFVCWRNFRQRRLKKKSLNLFFFLAQRQRWIFFSSRRIFFFLSLERISISESCFDDSVMSHRSSIFLLPLTIGSMVIFSVFVKKKWKQPSWRRKSTKRNIWRHKL